MYKITNSMNATAPMAHESVPFSILVSKINHLFPLTGQSGSILNSTTFSTSTKNLYLV